ncbi:MAG: GEVED domain-containing protein, partial [Chlorobiales bacterium]|nr:GEVED domain-containing protein [Chlorobiales bacterium]
MDDEDGVVFTSTLTPGTTASVTVTASVPGLLYGWIDFDRNGNFEMPRDYVFSGQLLSAGPNVLGMAIPADAAPGLTFARFRFSRDSVLDPEGPAPNGEVEDYQVEIVDGGGTDK